MIKGVITTEYKKRLVDHIADLALKMKLFQTDGYYPITETATGKEVGRFTCVKGPRLIIKFLEKITDYHGPNSKSVEVSY